MTPSISAALLFAATGDKVAYNGRVWIPGGGSKNISRLGFRFGAVTKAGGSALTVSLQDPSAVTGSPMQPDEVQDQTVAIANGDAGFAANVWYRTAALSATRAVAQGDFLSVVFEYDGAGRLGADTVSIAGLTKGSQTQMPSNHQLTSLTKTAGTWVDQLSIPNIILEFDDGTFGTLEGSYIFSALNTQSFANSATPDEIAVPFTVPYPCTVDGLWTAINFGAAGRNCELNLYAGTVSLAAVTADTIHAVNVSTRTIYVPIPVQNLVPGVQYYAAVKPTTAANTTFYSTDVADANHLTVMSGGPEACYASRVDAGAWTILPTRRLFGGVRFTSLFF